MQTQQLYFESVCRVLGGRVRRCVLKGEVDELVIDVVEIRVVPPQFVNGCRQRAHGTVTVEVRSDRVMDALIELTRSQAAVVLQRPDGGALEMRCCDMAPTACDQRADGSPPGCIRTFSWRAP